MSGEKEKSESSTSEVVAADAAPASNGAKAKKTSSCSSKDSPVLASQKTEPAVNCPGFVDAAESPKVGKKELPPPVPDSPTVASAAAAAEAKKEKRLAEDKKDQPEKKEQQASPKAKLSAVAAARAAMLSGGGGGRGGGGSGRPAPRAGTPITDVRKRALASHQMMQAWGKKKRGPRAENQFLKIERNEAEAYALDLSMRLYMELIRGLDGNGDVARCSISAEETRKLRGVVIETLEKNLEGLMKEFCIDVPDPEHTKKAEEEKLKSQAETATAELENEEARERDWESKEAPEGAKSLSSSADDDATETSKKKEAASAAEEEAATEGEKAEDGAKASAAVPETPATSSPEEAEKSEPTKTAAVKGSPETAEDAGAEKQSAVELDAGDDSLTSEKESPDSTKEEGNASEEEDSEDSGASDKRKRKSRRKKPKKAKKDSEEAGKKVKSVSREPSTEDVTKDDIAEDGGSDTAKDGKSDAKKKRRKKEKSAEELPLRSAGADSKARKKKRSRRLSTSALASVFVSSNSKSADDDSRASKKKEKEKKEAGSDGDPAPSPTLSRAANESGDLKKKHRFPGAGPLGRLLKKTNSRLDNSSAIEESKEPKKGRGRDRKKGGKKDDDVSDSDASAKRGTFQRPTLSKDGSSAGSRGRNRQRSAAGRPMLTRGGTGAKIAGPTVPMITLKRNMVDVEKLNALLEDAVKAAFSAPSRIAADYCPHEEGELDYYFLSLQGPRAANEDEYCVVEHVNDYFDLPEGTPNYSFFGVYDGHSGKFGSIYTRSQLISQIFNHPDFHTDPDKAFNDAFLLTDKLINDIEERENFDCGTTAISCCIRDHKELLISNVGDCEGFTCRAGKPVRMAVAHRPSDEEEKARIKALGGAVVWFGTWRVNGMLAVSRSLGDHSVKNLVIAQPDTSRLEVTAEDEFLVCASDGIWDVLDFPAAIEIVYATLRQGKGRRACCKEICEEALRRGTKDNVTVVVIFFQREVAGLTFEQQVQC